MKNVDGRALPLENTVTKRLKAGKQLLLGSIMVNVFLQQQINMQ
jgi:predicted component of type VI protein secretion system